MKTEQLINSIPVHVAIIMDGNGRWAQQHGLTRIQGHREGAESVRAILKACKKAKVKYLTLYAFSTENWIRPKTEIKGLMKLLVEFLKNHEADLHQEKIRLRVIGRPEDLPQFVRSRLQRAVKATEHYQDAQLILALSYGGRDEIVHATRAVARLVKAGELNVDDIDKSTVAGNLYAPDIPDPDFLIRTSGEMRISNFLLWQLSYTEFYVTNTLWPDFREKEFFKALAVYAKRHRRFGDVKQQA